MSELTETELMPLMNIGYWAAFDIGTTFMFMRSDRVKLLFKKNEKEFRDTLLLHPETLRVTAEELRNIAEIKDVHITEDHEVRFRDGLIDWWVERMLDRRQGRAFTPGSGQTISLKSHQAPIQVTDRKSAPNV